MSWVTGLLVFVVIWWLVFFMTLPFGVRAQHEADDADIVAGTVPSAPVKPRLVAKALVTTAISALLFAVYWYVANRGLISFRPE